MSYTEQFHKLSIRGGLEDEEEKIDRYLNELRFNLQDEIGLQMPGHWENVFSWPLEQKRS